MIEFLLLVVAGIALVLTIFAYGSLVSIFWCLSTSVFMVVVELIAESNTLSYWVQALMWSVVAAGSYLHRRAYMRL